MLTWSHHGQLVQRLPVYEPYRVIGSCEWQLCAIPCMRKRSVYMCDKDEHCIGVFPDFASEVKVRIDGRRYRSPSPQTNDYAVLSLSDTCATW